MGTLKPEDYSEEHWEYLRQKFADSALKDTEMVILGQNAGFSWPFKGVGETPEKYIQYTFEELAWVPGLIGKKKRIQRLMDILSETLAFDDPFSDLADSLEAECEVDQTFERILTQFNIDHDFPVDLLHFAPEVQHLIQREQITTLVELVHFGQQTAPSDIESQDLKGFLNGLAHKDERGIANHVPYRPEVGGLHLLEALGLIAEALPESTQVYLFSQTETALQPEEAERLEALDTEAEEANLLIALDQASSAREWFKQESREIEESFRSAGAPERLFIAINDPARERLALALAKRLFGQIASKNSGLMGKLFGR